MVAQRCVRGRASKMQNWVRPILVLGGKITAAVHVLDRRVGKRGAWVEVRFLFITVCVGPDVDHHVRRARVRLRGRTDGGSSRLSYGTGASANPLLQLATNAKRLHFHQICTGPDSRRDGFGRGAGVVYLIPTNAADVDGKVTPDPAGVVKQGIKLSCRANR